MLGIKLVDIHGAFQDKTPARLVFQLKSLFMYLLLPKQDVLYHLRINPEESQLTCKAVLDQVKQFILQQSNVMCEKLAFVRTILI